MREEQQRLTRTVMDLRTRIERLRDSPAEAAEGIEGAAAASAPAAGSTDDRDSAAGATAPQGDSAAGGGGGGGGGPTWV